MMRARVASLVAGLVLLCLVASEVNAQGVRVRDVTIPEGEIPVRLVGYGLVTGLGGTGDRVFGSREGNMTVRSIANLLRNMGIEVPEYVIRSRNAAAVLVTAEASPYTRAGGQFDVRVASLGDASSLRGGVLWQTPLVGTVGGATMAVAEGAILLPSRTDNRRDLVETSARLIDAAVAVAPLGSAPAGPPQRLLIRDPDLATAQRVADAINATLGADVATVEDPGAVALQLPADNPLGAMVQLGDLTITPSQTPRVVVDAASGVVAAGGEITVGTAVVSHDWLTLTVSSPDPNAAPNPNVPGAPNAPLGANGLPTPQVLPPGAVRAEAGVQVQSLAEALHAVGATAEVIGAVFRSLRAAGALHAEVEVR
ncbi:MAG: flagellar basal body P-ring protein FlgI [Gemmatimonadota bacterium]